MEVKNIDKYLDQIAVPLSIRSKIMTTLAFYRDNQLLNPTHIFVNQQKDAEKNIRHDKLWLFDGHYCAESDISNGKFAGDMAVIENQVIRYEITASDTNFDDANNEASLNLQVYLTDHVACLLQAFGSNRMFLWNLFNSHIKDNLIKKGV